MNLAILLDGVDNTPGSADSGIPTENLELGIQIWIFTIFALQ